MASFDLTDEESKITVNAEQMSTITDGIIWGTLTIMKRTIARESPEECAVHDSKPFKQSKTAVTDNTISINILTNNRKLPTRPRDFRAVLANEEKNIGNPELSDVLSSISRRLILKRSKKELFQSKGKTYLSVKP